MRWRIGSPQFGLDVGEAEGVHRIADGTWSRATQVEGSAEVASFLQNGAIRRWNLSTNKLIALV